MSKDNPDSFRELNGKEKIAAILGIAILIILVIVFVLGFYFFGIAGLFKLLGVQYTSIWSLVVFVVCFFLVSIIVELFTNAIYKLSVQNISGKGKQFFIRICFEGASNWFVLFTVDEFMKSITLSLQTELIIALLLAILECVFDKEDD
ncbi:YrvL family regulatory protein [Gracilibacillus xinjiangensis]|uniref:YrvL family regulatory protein n=1 Tax=Gracilibacillus xinjiangensis TaxID=1193282 RepID=A0ABV8WVI0_9BACI